MSSSASPSPSPVSPISEVSEATTPSPLPKNLSPRSKRRLFRAWKRAIEAEAAAQKSLEQQLDDSRSEDPPSQSSSLFSTPAPDPEVGGDDGQTTSQQNTANNAANNPGPGGPAPPGTAPDLRPDMSDMQQSHTWKGQRQPPIGARLLQILTYLDDEDIDRRRDWARELNEAATWVDDMLALRDENGLGDNTIRLLRLASDKIAVHRRNEAFHYRTFLPLTIPNPADMPTYAPRLPWNGCQDPIEFAPSGPKCKTDKILPTIPDVPRPWTRCNDLWLTQREATLAAPGDSQQLRDEAIAELAADQDALLATPFPSAVPEAGNANLAVLESQWYHHGKNGGISASADGALVTWTTYTENGNGVVVRGLEDTVPLGFTPADYAMERGYRRAGLEAALRRFDSTENHLIANNGRMLVLPGGVQASAALNLDEVRRKAGIGSSRPIELPELEPAKLQRIDGKTDPQGFIANMAQFWINTREADQAAHKFATDQLFRNSREGPLYPDEADADTPLPPDSVFGPFVWRGVPAHVQLRQDLLRQMRGLKRLFDRERRINDRTLLDDMETAYDLGINMQLPGALLQLAVDRDVIQDFDAFNSPTTGEERGDNPRMPDTYLLEKVEMEWLRFLLNNSTTTGMTVATLPRTTLFLVFAERLERIFKDPGDSLFPDRDTSVGIEELIAHMANMKGPVKKTTFYPYDVKMFLERLAHQGRCRYTEDWRTYGQVQRPSLDYFPEHLVIWQPRDAANADSGNFPEDLIPETPRFTDRRTWLDIMQNDAPGNELDRDVRNYFLCLAFKWGRSMDKLEGAEPTWASIPNIPLPAINEALDSLTQGYGLHYTANDPAADVSTDTTTSQTRLLNPTRQLRTLWRTTLDTKDVPPVSEGKTIGELIQARVIDEVVRADNMLYPGRTTDYLDPDAPKTRESIWDWARPAIRGQVKQFFSLDRWPLELQKPATQARIKSDVDVDPELLFNPIVEDPTPWTYYRPKARPYGEDRVKFRDGHRMFPIGDTARQREVVKKQVMTMVGRAMGIMPDPNDGQSWLTRLFSRKRARPMDNPDEDDEDEVLPRHKLPRVDARDFPPRVDRVAMAEKAKRDHADATRLVAVPADQVPAGARDINQPNRTASAAPGALYIEQNMSLGGTAAPAAAVPEAHGHRRRRGAAWARRNPETTSTS